MLTHYFYFQIFLLELVLFICIYKIYITLYGILPGTLEHLLYGHIYAVVTWRNIDLELIFISLGIVNIKGVLPL